MVEVLAHRGETAKLHLFTDMDSVLMDIMSNPGSAIILAVL